MGPTLAPMRSHKPVIINIKNKEPMRMGDARKTEASLSSALTALMSDSEFSSIGGVFFFIKLSLIY